MNMKRCIVYLLVASIGCTPTVVKKEATTIVEPVDHTTPIVSESSRVFQMTYLDSLNKNKEIRLNDTDFGKEIRPSVIQTVEQSGSGYEIHYRIQIFASSSVETLREQKQIMEKKTDLPFYLTFEPPFYKLFVGDFLLRTEAEAMLPKVKKFGYTDAWIVTARSLN